MANKKDIFYEGMRLLVEIFEKKYQGSIIDFSESEKSINIRLSNPDATLIHVMPDTECKLKFIAEDGMAYNVATSLLKRKIPNITIKYPDKMEGVSIRKYLRVPTSYWTSILSEKNEPVGDGTIVGMSLGGCKLMTVIQYKIGSPVWLSFNYGENDSQLTFKGIIRNMKPAPYDSTYYGIEFDQPTESFLKALEELLKNPTA
jgi:c-di-GMP-binding flagellar brake protein YcgR